MTLRTERIRTLDEVRAFLEGSEPVDFALNDRDSAYLLVRRSLERLRYYRLGKRDKGLVKAYLAKVTDLSRVIAQHKRTCHVRDRRRKPPANAFQRRYTPGDAALLAEVDVAYDRLSGPATKEVLGGQYEVHGDGRFERLAHISNGHIYNLQKRRDYRLGALSLDKTRPVQVSIGVRRKPDPDGRPGFVRVDTVHQGDRDGEKGLYALNVVDQVTQFEHIGAVVRITEIFMLPVLEDLLTAFPFQVRAFHADNGSEYVKHHVAGMLNKLHIGQFTKSRPRHSNDNALVESKNGAIVRKWLGRAHIPARCAPAVNDFIRDHLCPFLNFHRPCLFPSEVEGPRGRIKKRYRQPDVATPYEKLEFLDDAEDFLRPGLTFEELDRLAASGLQAAKAVRETRRRLFRTRRRRRLRRVSDRMTNRTQPRPHCYEPRRQPRHYPHSQNRPRALTPARGLLQPHLRIGKHCPKRSQSGHDRVRQSLPLRPKELEIRCWASTQLNCQSIGCMGPMPRMRLSTFLTPTTTKCVRARETAT